MHAVAGGRRAGHATHESPFSFESNPIFMEMATEHRRVVDFLCQACHRVSSQTHVVVDHNSVELCSVCVVLLKACVT